MSSDRTDTRKRLEEKIERWRGPCSCGSSCLICASYQSAASELERLLHSAEPAEDLKRTLDLIHDSDMRAIAMWRKTHPGNELVQPDRAKMIFWLLEQLPAEPVREQPIPAPMHKLRALVAKWLKSAEGYDYIVDDVGDCAAASQRKACADELGALLAAQPIPAEGAQVRNDALLEAARAICDRCRIDGPPRDCINDSEQPRDGAARFVHIYAEGEEFDCPAAEILALAAATPATAVPAKARRLHGHAFNTIADKWYSKKE